MKKKVVWIAAAAVAVCAAAVLWLALVPAAEEISGDIPESWEASAEAKEHTGETETFTEDVSLSGDEIFSETETSAKEPAIAPEVWEISLDQAVTEAIWANHDLPEDALSEYYCCETHVLLDVRNQNGESVAAGTGEEQEVTVYAVAALQACEPLPEKIQTYYRRYFAAEMTFSLEAEEAEDGEAVPVWTLEEFWRTTGNSYHNDFQTSVWQRFPEDLADEMSTTYTRQNTLDWLVSALNAQAIAYGGIDAERLVADMFDAVMVPIDGDDSLFALWKHPEYIELHFYGDYTLQYIFREFSEGGQTDRKGEFMFSMLAEMLRIKDYWLYGSTGQERFDNYLAEVRQSEEEQGREWMEENEPAKLWFLQKWEELQP